MAQLEEILGKKINSVKELRSEIKRLQDSLVGVDAESEQFKTTSQQLAAAQDELRKVTRASVDDNLAAKDSIVGMQQEYKKLYDQYKLLSDEQRNSDFGKGMAESLNTLSQKLNSTKKDVGSFKDNIGRYAGDVTQVFQTMGISIGSLQTPMKLAAGGARTLGAALMKLAANPVGAAIMLIVVALKSMEAIFKRVKKAINDNEDSQMRLKEAMASFQPVINIINNLWDKLGQILVKVIEYLTKAYEKIIDVATKFTDFIGITKNANKYMNEQIAISKELVKAQNELTKAKREAQVQNAKDTAEVERLREEASETDNLVEKKKMLEEAKRIQGEIDARNVEIAKEEARIIEEQSKQTANSAAENDKLAEALAKVAQAEADAARNARQFNREITRVSKSTSSAGASTVDYRKKAQELLNTLIEANKSEIQKLDEKYKEEKKLLEKYHLDTTLLTKKYNKDLADLNEKAIKEEIDKRVKQVTASGVQLNRLMEALKELYADNAVNLARQEANAANITQGRFKRFVDAYNELTQQYERGTEGWLTRVQEIIAKINELEPNLNISDLSVLKILNSEKDKEEVINNWEATVETIGEAVAKKAKEASTKVKDTIANDKIDKTVKENLINSINSEIAELLRGGTLEEFNRVQEENRRNNLIKEKTAYEEILASFSGTEAQKLEILQQYYDVVAELREQDWEKEEKYNEYLELNAERTQEVTKAGFEAYDKVNASIGTLLNSYAALVQAQLNDGKITEAEAKKKIKTLKNLEKIQLAVNVAGIAASTAAGIMDVWKGYASELKLNSEAAAFAGPIAPERKAWLDGKSLTAAILRTTGLAATGAANIAAATMGTISTIRGLNAQMADLGSAAAVAAPTPQLIDSTPYTYARTLQTQEEEDEMNRPIYVTVTDIEDGLKNKVTVTNESSF